MVLKQTFPYLCPRTRSLNSIKRYYHEKHKVILFVLKLFLLFEKTESTESAESTESTESAESAESTESSDHTEHTEHGDHTEFIIPCFNIPAQAGFATPSGATL